MNYTMIEVLVQCDLKLISLYNIFLLISKTTTTKASKTKVLNAEKFMIWKQLFT